MNLWTAHRSQVHRNRTYQRRSKTHFRPRAQHADNCLWPKLYVPSPSPSPPSKGRNSVQLLMADFFLSHGSHLRSKRSYSLTSFFSYFHFLRVWGRREPELTNVKQVGDAKYQDLVNSTWVGNGRFVVDNGKLTVETRVSKLIPSRDMD